MVRSYREHKDNRAFQILFLSNIGLVRVIVRNYVRKNGRSFEDFFQEGLIALLKAIENFDPSKEVKMSTYIDKAVRRYITTHKERRDNIVVINWTPHRRKLRIALLEKMNSEPTDNITENWIRRFAEENPQYSVNDIRSVLPILLHRTHISLNDPVSSHTGKDLTLLDNLPDQRVDVERKAMDKIELLRVYNWIMEEIKDKRKIYRVIVKDRLFSSDPRILPDIAQEFNVSYQYVAKTEESIKNRIKNQFPDLSKRLASQ